MTKLEEEILTELRRKATQAHVQRVHLRPVEYSILFLRLMQHQTFSKIGEIVDLNPTRVNKLYQGALDKLLLQFASFDFIPQDIKNVFEKAGLTKFSTELERESHVRKRH